jgi:hypothetical protein
VQACGRGRERCARWAKVEGKGVRRSRLKERERVRELRNPKFWFCLYMLGAVGLGLDIQYSESCIIYRGV